MKIKEWLQTRGSTAEWLASKVGITSDRMRSLVRGALHPRAAEIVLIYDITDGDVRAEDWANQAKEMVK